MKIVEQLPTDEELMTFDEAHSRVKRMINNTADDYLFVVKYDGKLISFSGKYYKFAWKSHGMLKNALSQKFGREVAQALVENDVIQIVKVYI